MTAIKIESFIGEIPAVDERLLPQNAASKALNTWLLSGRIEPVHSLVELHTLTGSATDSWFRLPNSNPDIDGMNNSSWLEFTNPTVRVVRSPVSGQDDDGRFYWADGYYPKYMTGNMISAGNQPYKLGIPTPPVSPTVSSDFGSGTNETRAYVYTWVSSLGEEGPPSPPTLHDGKTDDVWTVGMTPPDSSQTAERTLAMTRIYRTVTSAQGIAEFYFVAEVDIATTQFEDNIASALVVANGPLQSLYWSEPPYDLQGLVTMPNGMLAGWRSNEVWFCEPYRAHAWPPAYVIAVDNDIVGLGVFNQSLIILCDGQPYSATGVDPSSMALAKIQPLEVCVSQRSIVSTPSGVLYASPNGLINITPAGAQNLTKDMILKDQWNEMFNLSSLSAGIIMNGYYAYSTSENNAGVRMGMYVTFDKNTALIQLDPADQLPDNIVTDVFNGELMVSRAGKVYVLDVRRDTPYNEYVWRSKVFTIAYLDNFAAAKVYWTPPTSQTTQGKSYFRFYAGTHDDLVGAGLPKRYERELLPSGAMYRLPSGYKAIYCQIEIAGTAVINSVHLASSARELRSI